MKMQKHVSHGSPASMGAHKGGGFMAGAGELNSPGSRPGKNGMRQAGGKDAEFPTSPTPSGSAPKGMKTYREE